MGKQATVIRKTRAAPVPELAAKQQKREAEWAAKAAEVVKARQQLNVKNHSEAYKRALKYEREYFQADKSLQNRREQAYLSGNFFVEPEPKLAFAIRIRGLKDVLPKAKKALRLMRLTQINTGVFIRLNKSALQLLKIVEPYVAWGYINRETASKLIYARGYGKVAGNRTKLNSNQTIAASLSRGCDIICLEDLVHEIVTVGRHFKTVNNFLWPFKLRPPRGGYESIKKHFVIGGSFGNREAEINTLVNRML
mmetsp:Transcript_9814/g.14474  ORF Transcript_9814/g.14474 Transcript_9814/m.14474 type:complete len:252 (+) Transcript_9814:47-802(+)